MCPSGWRRAGFPCTTCGAHQNGAVINVARLFSRTSRKDKQTTITKGTRTVLIALHRFQAKQAALADPSMRRSSTGTECCRLRDGHPFSPAASMSVFETQTHYFGARLWSIRFSSSKEDCIETASKYYVSPRSGASDSSTGSTSCHTTPSSRLVDHVS